MADKKINKNKISDRLRSAEQCFLVANIPSLVETEEGKGSIKQSLCRYHISLSSGQHTKIKQIATADRFNPKLVKRRVVKGKGKREQRFKHFPYGADKRVIRKKK